MIWVPPHPGADPLSSLFTLAAMISFSLLAPKHLVHLQAFCPLQGWKAPIPGIGLCVTGIMVTFSLCLFVGTFQPAKHCLDVVDNTNLGEGKLI